MYCLTQLTVNCTQCNNLAVSNYIFHNIVLVSTWCCLQQNTNSPLMFCPQFLGECVYATNSTIDFKMNVRKHPTRLTFTFMATISLLYLTICQSDTEVKCFRGQNLQIFSPNGPPPLTKCLPSRRGEGIGQFWCQMAWRCDQHAYVHFAHCTVDCAGRICFPAK